jgi:hypothetical protein
MGNDAHDSAIEHGGEAGGKEAAFPGGVLHKGENITFSGYGDERAIKAPVFQDFSRGDDKGAAIFHAPVPARNKRFAGKRPDDGSFPGAAFPDQHHPLHQNFLSLQEGGNPPGSVSVGWSSQTADTEPDVD